MGSSEGQNGAFNSNLILGIDPGFTGALALLDPGMGSIVDVWDMPLQDNRALLGVHGGRSGRHEIDVPRLAEIIRPLAPHLSMAVVERVSASPGAGVASMFRFGEGYGMLLGVLAGCGVGRVLKPGASVWKVSMGLSTDKRLSIDAVGQYLGITTREKYCPRVKDHGRAEAIMISIYGSRIRKELKSNPPPVKRP